MTPELVKFTFYITYIMLLTTGTITFIEAISTKDMNIRHIMNVETCISIVAAYFYSTFVAKVDKSINYEEITKIRYIDWFITTPLMLLVLCLVLSFSEKKNLHIFQYVVIVVLNYAMLTVGFMGESKQMDKRTALLFGFLFYAALFGYIGYLFIDNSTSIYNLAIYGSFVVSWGLYGVFYVLHREDIKNIGFNILDLFAKCLVGIFFWMYFAKVLVV